MTRKNYHIILDIIATAIIALAVILTIIVGYNYLKFPSPKIQTIKIQYNGIKTDSIKSLVDLLKKELVKAKDKSGIFFSKEGDFAGSGSLGLQNQLYIKLGQELGYLSNRYNGKMIVYLG